MRADARGRSPGRLLWIDDHEENEMNGWIRQCASGQWVATSSNGAHERCFETREQAENMLAAWEN